MPFSKAPAMGRSRRVRVRALLRILVAASLANALAPLRAAPPYELGTGYPLPWLSLTAGGYVTLRGGKLEGERGGAVLKDLSLFLSTDLSPRWHFFTELEVGDALTWTSEGPSITDAEFDLERFYLDRNLTPRTTLRLGKFLTPVGRWNLIHAEPLVWSVFRPLTTSAAFARHTSGVSLLGSWAFADSTLDYQVYVDDAKALDPGPAYEATFVDAALDQNPNNVFEQGAGLHLRYQVFGNNLQIGLSAARFTLSDQPGIKNLVGADFYYARDGIELTGEAVYRSSSGVDSTEWGGLGQLVLPFGHGIYGILSAERFKAEGYSQSTDVGRLGIAYRPTPPVTFKIELQESQGVEQLAPDGWQLSLSVLF
jgi:hypothetical protein